MTDRPQDSAEVRGHGAATDGQRAAAIGALCAAQDDAAAAEAAGVTTRTLRRWKRDDEAFKAELAEALDAVKRANVERGAGLLGKAVSVLAKHLDADDLTAALGVFRALTAQKVETKNEHTGPNGAPLVPPRTEAEAKEHLEALVAEAQRRLK